MSGREVLGLLAFAGLVGVRGGPGGGGNVPHPSRPGAGGAAAQNDGDPRAAELARLLEHRERVLNPILLVLLACHLAAATIVAVLAADRWGPAGVIVSFVVEAIVIFVLARGGTEDVRAPGHRASRVACDAAGEGDRVPRAVAVGHSTVGRRRERDHPRTRTCRGTHRYRGRSPRARGCGSRRRRHRGRRASTDREHDRVR